MQEVRIGFIGCGGNANGHMRRLSELEGVRIVGVCDVQEERAQTAAGSYDAQPYTNHNLMLERDDLDGIYLSLPVFAHGTPELDVIERGLPFLVEKPVAVNMEIARQIEEAVDAAGIITCVGYQLRYLGSTQLARQVLRGETVNMVVGKYWSGSGRGDPNAWQRQMSKSGGQMLEQATHTIDMMRYLVGEVEEVYAFSANRVLKAIDCPDNNCVTMKFATGAVGSLTTSWCYDSRDWSHANVLDILYEDQLIHWGVGGLGVREDGEVVTKTAPGPSIDEMFVDAIRRGDASKILSPYSDAVKSLAISLAAIRSGETGGPVSIASIG